MDSSLYFRPVDTGITFPGRAMLLQASVHLALLAAYLFLAISP